MPRQARPTRRPPPRQARGPSPTSSPRAQALANLNQVVEQRDFGANLSRELARADLKLKPSEYLLIWAGCIVGVPAGMFLLSVRLPGARQPALPAHRRPHRLLHPALLAQPPQERPARRLQQAAPGHDHPDRQRAARRLVVPAGHRAGRPRVAAADLDRVRPGHPRGQPRPAVRPGAREHGPPRAVGRPRADGHRHLHPAPGRRQPRRDPRLDRVHDPRARPDQGRDPDPDRAAAPVGLRRRLPADRPGRLPVRRRARLHGADVRERHPRSSACRPA